MRLLLGLTVLFATVACSNKPDARSCAMVERDARPKISFAWRVAHGSMDDDPPRAHVKLTMSGAANGEIDVGDLEGICKLAETGALPDQPAIGSKVSELECVHGVRGMLATVFLVEPGKLSVRRYERAPDGEALKNLRALRDLEVPACVSFNAELAQAGEL